MELYHMITVLVLAAGYDRCNSNGPILWRRQPAIRKDDGYDASPYNTRCFFASNVHPCTCGGDIAFPLLTCDSIDTLDALQRVFLRWFSRKNLGKFSLTNSRISTWPKNMFREKKFQYIFAKKNTLTKIERGIFLGMKDHLRRIEIIHNDLVEFPFYDMSQLYNLEYLTLTYNDLDKIPDSAFGHNPSLKKIKLDFNKIIYVGSNSFKDLPALLELDLSFNKITVLTNRAFAGKAINPRLILILSSNRIQHMPDDSFVNQSPKVLNISNNKLTKFDEKIMLPILEGMVQRNDGYIIASGNRFRCTCNNIAWLVRKPDSYKRHVEDFQCANIKKELLELSLSDMGCPPSG